MNTNVVLDNAFRERIASVFHDDGAAWLAGLAALLDEFARRWALDVGAAFAPLSYNYVAPATRADGSRAVLKAGVPRHDLQFEIEALRHYDGHGAVRLLEADVDAGVFLLERAEPGTPILAIDDAEATRIAARVMLDLWRPPRADHTFPTIEDWGRAFGELRARHGGTSGPLPPALFDRGESLYHDLTATQAEAVVLHGDLHHWNIVRAERAAWLAIDPHGLVGEPAFEVGSWMRNPVGDPGDPDEGRFLLRQPNPRAIIARRLDIFAEELQIDRDRLRDWSLAFAVISACWSDESNHENGVAWSMAAAAVIAEA